MIDEIPRSARPARWEQIRGKGKARFIWSRGVLGWGIPVAVLYSLWMTCSTREGSLAFQPFHVKLLVYLAPSLILFPLGGGLWGLVMWMLFEQRYHKVKATSGTHAS